MIVRFHHPMIETSEIQYSEENRKELMKQILIRQDRGFGLEIECEHPIFQENPRLYSKEGRCNKQETIALCATVDALYRLTN